MNKWFKFGITNFFTALRAAGIVCLIPVFKIYGGLATALLSAGCFATDFIDGILARKLKSSTFFGSLFDAISDKAFLIVNMILLMSITPLAIVPILAELGIATVQSLKYQKNMNVQSNIFGKVKMWVAGITISLTYLLTDLTFVDYLGADLATKISELGNLKLFGITLAPLVLSEIATLSSYIKEFIDDKKEVLEEEKVTIDEVKNTEELPERKAEEKLESHIANMSLKDMLFDHDFYEKYKDEGNLKLIRSMAKKKK
ncbi:MAG TPA: CDP-alcohol phosphatidyltransferase family protein [Candidatus Onthocola stercoravium]|nr:CDP-alcohol phosphatidyltransferase family protein [Candidatus Onthocola stercoravium]